MMTALGSARETAGRGLGKSLVERLPDACPKGNRESCTILFNLNFWKDKALYAVELVMLWPECKRTLAVAHVYGLLVRQLVTPRYIVEPCNHLNVLHLWNSGIEMNPHCEIVRVGTRWDL